MTIDVDDEIAHVTGYYTRGNATDLRRIGYFQLGLRRSGDRWLISSEAPSFPQGPQMQEADADTIIAMMDTAGVERGLILSAAAGFGGYWVDIYREEQTPAERYPKVRAENDWLAAQVSRYPDRLVSFCGFNTLEPYALDEIRRCAKTGHGGLKLHFDEDQLDLRRKDHIEKARQVFELANELNLHVMVHLANNEGDHEDTAVRMKNFFDVVVAAAPDITIQIAHLWGGGSYSEGGLAVLADRMSSGHASNGNVYIDIADITRVIDQYEEADTIWQNVAVQIRRIGIDRILFGSDGGFESYHGPGQAWEQFVTSAPLADYEFERIANNLAPYWQ